MSHVRKASEAVSEGGSETESVIIFNENVFLAMQDAEISTTTYVKQAQQIIENLSTMPERWIKTPKSINNVAASKVLDEMLKHARETGGDSSVRYTACAICACPEIHEQVELARTWFMYLLWPCELNLKPDRL